MAEIKAQSRLNDFPLPRKDRWLEQTFILSHTNVEDYSTTSRNPIPTLSYTPRTMLS